jgi:zinc protease
VETAKSVGALTLDDVKSWYASAYRPDLTTIVVIGNVKPARARATIEKYFGSWKAVGPKPDVYPPPVPPNVASSVDVPATGRIQSSTQLVETIGLLRNDPDWPAMEVGNAALSGGEFSSLLYQDLRVKHGYAYYVGSELSAGKVRSTFSVSYGSDPKNIVPAQTQVLATIRSLQTKPIAATRLLNSKAQLISDIPLQQASYNGVGSLLLSYATRELPLDQNLIDAKRELLVTPADVQAAMAKWIRLHDFVRIVTGPGPK